MFELPPFRKCPRCKSESFGTLSVGGNRVTKRCKDCKYSHDEVLPDVDKRVVYLDQFAVSELYKTKAKRRKPGAPHEQFWQDCYSLGNLAYLTQQVIFPASNLHSDETIVWHSPEELRLAHEMYQRRDFF
jgi:transcription elongation factor Elf1